MALENEESLMFEKTDIRREGCDWESERLWFETVESVTQLGGGQCYIAKILKTRSTKK